MLRISRATTFQFVEAIYASFVLFALTQGPVYQLWSESVAAGGEEEIPNAIHIHYASFVVLQLPALVLLSRRIELSWFKRRELQLLMLFLGWLVVCALLSTLARKSIPDVSALVLTSSFGLYLARSFNASKLWLIIASATSLGVGLSTFAAYRLWQGAVNLPQDFWIGIYFNRNSLAPVAAVAIIGCCGVAAGWRWRKRPSSIAVAVLLVVAVGYATQALINSRSRTSLAAVALAAALTCSWGAIRMLSVRFTALARFQRWWLPVLIVTSGVGLVIVVQALPSYSLFNRELTSFNSRSVLWSQAWSGILVKPVFGWGWLAAWHVREFWEQGAWWSVWGENDWSHNGYLDVLLGGGFIAGFLFVALIVLAASRMSNHSEWSKMWPHILLFAFILAAATQESFFVGSHFLWALLICSVTIHWENPNLLLKKQDTTKSLS
jgi:O-antigen ligase